MSTAADRARLESVDLLRGVIMVVMALDHTRDFFGTAGPSPTDMSATTPALFFTRWVTYFCAPVFFLLMGTGTYLARRRRSVRELSAFLATRGLWLIFLELTVVRCLCFQFNFDYRVTMVLVLWTLGWGMIALAGAVWTPSAVVAAVGLLWIARHDLLDRVQSSNPLFVALNVPGFLLATPNHVVFSAYPLLPWIAVAFVGYGLGPIFRWEDGARRRRVLFAAGGAAVLAFLLLRSLNAYGDPVPRASQPTALFTLLSFLNTTKYPPSLSFLLMTLGPALLFLSFFENGTPRFLRPALVIGKVPLFYYVLHFALIHLLAVVACFARYGAAHWMFESPDLGHYPFSAPPGWGYSLLGVYLMWGVVVVAMYPFCRWYAGLKGRRAEAWWSFL